MPHDHEHDDEPPADAAYVHVRNWDRYQHPDVTRNKETPAPWIKDAPGQQHDDDYRELTLAERGLLHSIRHQYALRKCSGLPRNSRKISSMIGAKCSERQLKALNHAGFIVFSASKTQATRLQHASLDGDVDGDNKQGAPKGAERERFGAESGRPAIVPERAPVDVAEHVEPACSSKPSRPADLLWDELERLFGPVVAGTDAHGKRNKAHKELRLQGATVELLRVAAARWPQTYPSATMTDKGVANHWPLLVAGARKPSGIAPCDECGVGGGFHAAGCTQAPGAQAGAK